MEAVAFLELYDLVVLDFNQSLIRDASLQQLASQGSGKDLSKALAPLKRREKGPQATKEDIDRMVALTSGAAK